MFRTLCRRLADWAVRHTYAVANSVDWRVLGMTAPPRRNPALDWPQLRVNITCLSILRHLDLEWEMEN